MSTETALLPHRLQTQFLAKATSAETTTLQPAVAAVAVATVAAAKEQPLRRSPRLLVVGELAAEVAQAAEAAEAATVTWVVAEVGA